MFYLCTGEYKPMSEVHENTFFKFKWRPTTKPKRQHNSAKTPEKLDEALRRSARNQTKKLEKLKEFGIDLKLEDIMVDLILLLTNSLQL